VQLPEALQRLPHMQLLGSCSSSCCCAGRLPSRPCSCSCCCCPCCCGCVGLQQAAAAAVGTAARRACGALLLLLLLWCLLLGVCCGAVPQLTQAAGEVKSKGPKGTEGGVTKGQKGQAVRPLTIKSPVGLAGWTAQLEPLRCIAEAC
jgi:hypothetical protein